MIINIDKPYITIEIDIYGLLADESIRLTHEGRPLNMEARKDIAEFVWVYLEWRKREPGLEKTSGLVL